MSLVLVEKMDGGSIWLATLNRPESLNALNKALIDELDKMITECSQDTTVKCLVFTGSGEKAFVAGADIKEFADFNPQQARELSQRGQQVFRKLEELNIPVIAAVNGFALGGGLELALSCDFIVASENAKFALPEVSLGVIPGYGGTVRLSRVVGLNKAREMILTGDMVASDEALRVGLVSKVVPQKELLDTVMKSARSIASRGPVAVAKAKASINLAFDQDIMQGMVTETRAFAQLFSTEDFKEGTKAFVEKRKPKYTGK